MTAQTNADVVIIGGGILGASIAWHLTQAGITDTVVLERNEVASGATAYTAGLVSLARTNRDALTMVRCTLSAIAELEACPRRFRGLSPHRHDAGRGDRRDFAWPGEHGSSALLDRNRSPGPSTGTSAREMVPWLDPDAAHSIIHVADDGYVDGHMLTSAYMRAARDAGAALRTRTSALARGPVRRASRRCRDLSRAHRVQVAGRRRRHLGGRRAPMVRRRPRGQSAQESLLAQRTRRGALAGDSGRLSSRRTHVPAPGRRRIAARDSGAGLAGVRRTTTARRHVRAGAHRRGGLGAAGQPCTPDQTLLPRLRRACATRTTSRA